MSNQTADSGQRSPAPMDDSSQFERRRDGNDDEALIKDLAAGHTVAQDITSLASLVGKPPAEIEALLARAADTFNAAANAAILKGETLPFEINAAIRIGVKQITDALNDGSCDTTATLDVLKVLGRLRVAEDAKAAATRVADPHANLPRVSISIHYGSQVLKGEVQRLSDEGVPPLDVDDAVVLERAPLTAGAVAKSPTLRIAPLAVDEGDDV